MPSLWSGLEKQSAQILRALGATSTGLLETHGDQLGERTAHSDCAWTAQARDNCLMVRAISTVSLSILHIATPLRLQTDEARDSVFVLNTTLIMGDIRH